MASDKPYSIARAELIADQIGRFATQHLHQLAGHHANLPFWLAEASAAVRTLDEYQLRFRQLRDAQLSWVHEHKTKQSAARVGRSALSLPFAAERQYR